MSCEPAIQVTNLSKRYVLQHQRDILLERLIVGPFRKRRPPEVIDALKDLNFTIQAGQTVGVVGRNGSGKSTLLKVLNRVTPPTTGEVVTRGKVAGLLELGAGFHYNLTGRENIFLNGSILGMKKREIEAMMASIVDFSGIGRFVDVPVRSYSSGMFVRLGFSIAIHLDPDILIMDEVLAVGDEEFQQKCLTKIAEFQQAGKTILLVSHNMKAVQETCQRALLLNQGELIAEGTADEVALRYRALQADGR